MNGNYSTTEVKASERLSDSRQLECQWKSIDWKIAEAEVNRLQVRIVKATQKRKWNDVKKLQYLLTHSFYAKALAVKRVTTNKGKKTAGIDGILWNTPAQKMNAVLSLTDKGYKASPLRRVFIKKKDKNKKRPLGIPTMYDRAMQALYALALDPVSEATADTKSFGFRKERCAQDACEYIFGALARRDISPNWILEGDIKGCFDHISHEWLLENIPMDKSILKQFLKAGFIFEGELFPTEDGTPQGVVISPILANMTLDGMQKALEDRFHTNRLEKVDLRFKNAHKVNFVRYADDFIVTAATEEIALEAKELLRDFLSIRGLELSDEKTVVTHVDKGFDFLGWTFRKFKGKLIIKPSKKSIKAIVSKLSDTINRRGKAWNQDVLIMKLNQQIRGWTNYHQSVSASEAFAHLDYVLFELLWHWAKRRHPKKGKWWISTKYWHRKGNRNWVFSTEEHELIRVDHTPIVRHRKVSSAKNPYIDTEYFIQRKFNQGMARLSGRFKLIWKNQDGKCYHCGMPLSINDDREIFYKIPKSKSGEDIVSNMAYDYHPEDKSISINEEEAEIVRYIFNRYIEGAGGSVIAQELQNLGYKTKRGSTTWAETTVLGIIKNEKYKGDILMGKTFTLDPITKRRLDNFGEEDQFYIRDHHEAIISDEVFDAAQEILKRRAKPRRLGTDGKREKFSRKYAFSCMIECGFCGGTLTRRSWHSGSQYNKIIWQCVTATKKGKKFCPDSKGIARRNNRTGFY